MYGVVKSVDRELEIFDGTHEIPQYDNWSASYRLFQYMRFWPPGTIFVSVMVHTHKVMPEGMVSLTRENMLDSFKAGTTAMSTLSSNTVAAARSGVSPESTTVSPAHAKRRRAWRTAWPVPQSFSWRTVSKPWGSARATASAWKPTITARRAAGSARATSSGQCGQRAAEDGVQDLRTAERMRVPRPAASTRTVSSPAISLPQMTEKRRHHSTPGSAPARGSGRAAGISTLGKSLVALTGNGAEEVKERLQGELKRSSPGRQARPRLNAKLGANRAMEKNKSRSLTVLCLAVACTAAAAFVAGWWYGPMTADSGKGKIVDLTEDQKILNDFGYTNGVLPKGMELYVVPDPYANELSLFKAYFQANDANTGFAAARSSRNEKGLKINFIHGEGEVQT